VPQGVQITDSSWKNGKTHKVQSRVWFNIWRSKPHFSIVFLVAVVVALVVYAKSVHIWTSFKRRGDYAG